MSDDFAAAVCEGFLQSLEELLSRDLPPGARKILSDLQTATETAIEALCPQTDTGCGHRGLLLHEALVDP